MLELLLIVLLLMLLRTATATLLLSFYYQPGTKHRSQTHTQTTNKNMKQPNSKTSGTSQLDTVQRTAFDTTLHQLQWLYHSTYIIRRLMPISLDSWQLVALFAYPQGLHCSWDRAPEVTALMSWRVSRLRWDGPKTWPIFCETLFTSQVSKHRKREMVLNRDHVLFVGVLLRAFVLEKSWKYVGLRAAKSLLSVKALRGATATACNSGGFLLDVTDDDEMEHETENNMEKHDNNSY